ncbi:Ger(x)C family spore germination protein [Desulfofundulus thermosubterraneus]|uniref:Spore germination protein KC n=1 Tax=Desulfofundulus thermosubterraneus DSM 16057 TaxID=1121432 RepID=A0A1M6EFD6_9FIRM|nr:Ger(x)C family spore germination protein [Desulfofundulus thermosubterraneus]SHI84192.1 spore germination protein KC [Desulfofundulus thermosubterraneus DSM 16057]
MKRRMLIILVLLICLNAGCWDLREVEDLGYVMAMAIDSGPQGKIRLIAQVPNPRVLGGGQRGGITPGASIAAKPYRNYEGTGSTIFDALREISRESSRRLFFAQNRTLIFSEAMAEKGVGGVLDFLKRSVEIRHGLTMVFVARGDPAKILDIPNPHATVPALRIDDIVRWRGQTSRFAPVPLSRFLETLSLEGQEPYAGVIEAAFNPAAQVREGEKAALEPPLTLRLTGAALFRNDRMVGFLDETETRGLLWVLNEVKGGQIVFPCPGQEGKKATIEILRANAKIEPEITEDGIIMTVKIREEGNLVEVEGPLDTSKPEVIKELDRLHAAAIGNEVMAAVYKAQELGSDAFGFGEAFRRKFPREWKKIKRDWPEIFPGIEVRVQVVAHIRRMGMTGKPPFLAP